MSSLHNDMIDEEGIAHRYNDQPNYLNKLKKDILVILSKKQAFDIKEVIQKLDIEEYLNDQKQIVLIKLLDTLKLKYNFPIENHQIFYYLHRGDIFMNCGNDPINQDITIDEQDYIDQPEIIIKCKEVPVSLIHKLMSEQFNQNMVNQRETQQGQANQTNKCRRTKQRRIGYIIDKVVKWRQFYSGVKQDNFPVKKYSLQQAANKVGISKKSLDDYLLQIRFGRKYGFNFNEHKNDKVGVLRDYVRKNKKINSRGGEVKKLKKKEKKHDQDS